MRCELSCQDVEILIDFSTIFSFLYIKHVFRYLNWIFKTNIVIPNGVFIFHHRLTKKPGHGTDLIWASS